MTEHFDRDAERSALGAMMLDSERVWDVLDVAPPSDFHDPTHELIAEAIRRLALRGEGTDPVLVESEIARVGGKLPQGPAYLYELTSLVATATSAGYYARIIADHAVRRRLALAGVTVTGMAADLTVSPAEQVEAARAAVDAVASGSVRDVKLIGEELDDTIAEMSEPPVYTETPWGSINHLIGGLRPRCMYVVGARPASGKTIFAMNSTVALASEGFVAVSSLEMGRAELHKRLMSQLGRVHMSAMVNNALEPADWDRIAGARSQLMGLTISIDDTPGQTLAHVRAHARSTARRAERAGRKLTGVVVDYLQLMESTDPRKDRRVQVGEFSRGMKLIAKEFDCPVIVLSQLNRKSEERHNKKPMLSDLRESGDLEQDADVVFLLSRDPDDLQRAGEVDVIVAKNRHGATGEVTLGWVGHYAAMEDGGADWAP